MSDSSPLRNCRCIVPDYRGAGKSSKPQQTSSKTFTKATMADDMVLLLDHLNIRAPVHVVGHDIGGMIAWSLAARHPERVRSLVWGECPLPGTSQFTRDMTVTANVKEQWHFIFHTVSDLPEALLSSSENVRIYLTHFFAKLAYICEGISNEDEDKYVAAYSQPGAIRCATATYRAFEEDAKENVELLSRSGKLKIPTLVLNGSEGRFATFAEEMGREVTVGSQLEVATVAEAGHYLAEEQPQAFAKAVYAFISKRA